MKINYMETKDFLQQDGESSLPTALDPPMAPSPAFMDALQHPQTVTSNKVAYAVYTFNKHHLEDERPVVMVRPTSNGTTSPEDAVWWNAFTQSLQRPVITFDLPSTGGSGMLRRAQSRRTSLDTIADSTVEILDELKVEEADLAGFCLGGLIAAKTATALGERSPNLITYSTPGFDSDLMRRFARYGDSMLGQVMDKYAEARDRLGRLGLIGSDTTMAARVALTSGYLVGRNVLQRLTADKSDPKKMPDVPETGLTHQELPPVRVQPAERSLIIANLCFEANKAPMRTLPDALHPATTWHDIVGSEDEFTGYRDHEAVITHRDRLVPGNNSLTVLPGADHAFMFRPNEIYMARHVEALLRGQ